MKPTLLLALQLSISAAVGCSVLKPSQCEDPAALSDGYVECADGSVNRVSPDACEVLTTEPTCEGTEDERSCETDADCTAAPNGTCLSGRVSDDYYGGGESYTTCGCAYPCSSDAECDNDQVCLCPSVGPNKTAYCATASCASDDDCAQSECGLSVWNDGCGKLASLHCRDAGDDTCRVHDDCEGSEDCGVDSWSSSNAWQCHSESCAIGRPLTIAAHARTAPLSAAPGWSHEALSLPRSPEAAEQWAQIALLEHASVASFARFTLQLMAMGAPADLLARTQRAAADEVAHAEGAFAVASALSGAPMAPGPLPLADLSIPLSPAEILGALIEEGCVGETLGAAEAALARSGCQPPQIATLLDRIQADETEHAALAWATLRWMLERDPTLIPLAAAHFSTAIQAAQERPLTEPGHPALGLPAGPARFAIHQQAIADVIQPAAEALLGAATPSRTAERAAC